MVFSNVLAPTKKQYIKMFFDYTALRLGNRGFFEVFPKTSIFAPEKS